MYPVAAKSTFLCSDKNTSCFFSLDFFDFFLGGGGGGGQITPAKDKDLRLWHFVHSAFTEANFLHVCSFERRNKLVIAKLLSLRKKHFSILFIRVK